MTLLHADTDVILHHSGESVSARPLQQYQWLRHASTTRHFSTPDAPRIEELKKVLSHLDRPDSILAIGEQKHTANVSIVTAGDIHNASPTEPLRYSQTDALVTAESGVTLAILTADCAPVFIVDPVLRVIGLAHAGWKGTLSRIVQNTVNAMKTIGSSATDLIAWVGPMAGACCYEVSEDLIEQFRQEFSTWTSDSIHKGRNLDLVGINCMLLEEAGVPGIQVHRSNLCTIHHREHFYSYRADKGTHGRIISAMTIV